MWVFILSIANANSIDFDSEQKLLIRELSHRDGSPACETLRSKSEKLQSDLLKIIEHVEQPGWVGMRAASCLIDIYPTESVVELEHWMTSENTMGLAYLLSTKIDQMPESVAIRVGKAGLDGPHSEGVKKRILETQSSVGRQLIEENIK